MTPRILGVSLASPFYSEKKFADKLGITRVEMRIIRKTVLTKKRDWTIAGRDIVLSQAAISMVLEYLRNTSNAELPADFTDCLSGLLPPLPPASRRRGQDPGTNDAGEKQTPPPAAQAAQELIVKRVYPNPRLLLALAPDGADVRVRVRNNQNFTPKMKLLAVPIGDGLYQMQGRCPRYKGRY